MMQGLKRLNASAAITAAAVLLLAGIALSIYFDRSYQSQRAEEIHAQARILAATVTAALSFDDHKAAQEYLDALEENPEIETAAIYSAEGALFAFYDASGAPPPSRAPAIEPPGGDGTRTLTVPVRQRNVFLGTVYVRARPEPLFERAARYAVITLFVVMAALIVLVLGAGQSALARANASLERHAAELETQIKEREKAEAALRQAQKMEAVGQLTGGVAHDFNNLLQVIIGNLDALRRGASYRVDEVRRHVDGALRGADRAAILTQRLLAFGRRQPLTPKPIEVNKLVSGMSDLLRHTLGEAISIETVLAGGLWPTFVDANQLENALLNLAVNARDAMAQGGKLTIETANAFLDEEYARRHEDTKAGQYVVIAVSDTGTGMTKDVAAKAFEPFFTTKDVGKGSGLGLSQVYGFIRQSGGHAKIYSEPGEGTTVKIYLPRLVGAEARLAEAAEARDIPGGDKELILMVEDDDDVRANSVGMLRELGYAVLEAADGERALRLLDRHPAVRLLFTDVGLPGGMNGRQLADEARRRRPDLLVLFTTGYARNAIVHHGRLDEGLALLVKPFTYAALAAKLRAVFETAASQSPARET